jgi:molybdenum cofactor cytidylyltransferase
MWFGELNTADALGCVLAHSVKLAGKRVSKGTQLTQLLIDSLLAEGISTVVVARLEADDVEENVAAMAVAEALCGDGLRVDKAHTGRVNIFASVDGLLCVDRPSIVALNSIDESLTFATLAENTRVLKGRMVATSKIITYAIKSQLLQQAVSVVAAKPLRVAPIRPQTAVLIQTRLPTIKETTLDKSRRVTEERLQSRYATLQAEYRCAHSVESLVAELRRPEVAAADWVLVAGASAISDRNDVIPAAVVEAGGSVDRYGIPVDPGNLLLLGQLGKSTVLGLPGCARSPKYNGLDQILDRLACDVAVTDEWLNSLCVGGLLDEDLQRPQPRHLETEHAKSQASSAADRVTSSERDPSPLPRIAGLVLAAGTSSRAGAVNKLLVEVSGAPMVRIITDALLQSRVDSVQVVTGHQHEMVEAALTGLSVESHYCPSYMMGMAHSLSHGISRLPACDAVLVCLADMPHVSSQLIDQLLAAVGSHAADVIAVPVYRGRRGNPVMVGKAFFDTLLQHDGDTGARFLMKQYPERVMEVEVSDNSVVTDYDTVEALDELSD